VRIIDRYLLRQFVQVFLICFTSITGLYLVFDAFSNLDEFMRYTEKEGGLLLVMGEFYAYRSIFFFDRASGMLTMIAGMFTVTWIQRHNELTALLAAGISRTRVILPIVCAAVSISLLTAANRELVIPRLAGELSKNPKDLRGEMGQQLRPRYDNETVILMRGLLTYAADQRIEKPNFLLPAELDHLGRQLAAANAYYQPARDGREAGYRMKEVTQPPGLASHPSLSIGRRRVIITPHDEPEWLEPDECFVVSNVSFEQLAGGRAWRQFSSTAELVEGLSNRSLDFGADVRVAIHTRMVQPLLDLNLLFLGLPLVLSRDNRNVFAAIGLCAILSTAFMLVVLGFQYLGTIYLLDPALAAWSPLMIFVPLAVALFEQVRR
jgi:lipopolysaccharide export system permease protein